MTHVLTDEPVAFWIALAVAVSALVILLTLLVKKPTDYSVVPVVFSDRSPEPDPWDWPVVPEVGR